MSGFGKSLLRSKKKEQADRRAKYINALETRNMANAAVVDNFHGGATDLSSQQHSSTLKSVWDTSNIENFLMAADAREAGYQADRNVKVVVDGAAHIVIGDKVAPLSDNQRDWLQLSAKLPIPKRPVWNFSMNTQQINVQELTAFHRWRESLNSIEEKNKVLLSPYEKNLEVWRQLWRVVERSDIVVNVVDARNPLAFRCVDFESYVNDHAGATGRPKPVMLLLNKADLLSERQREAWADYLNRHRIMFYFFAAKPLSESDAERMKSKIGRTTETSSDDDDDFDSTDDDEIDAENEVRREQEEALKAELDEKSGRVTDNTKTKSGRRGGKRRAVRGGVTTESNAEFYSRLTKQPVDLGNMNNNNNGETNNESAKNKKNGGNKKKGGKNVQNDNENMEGDVHLPPTGPSKPSLPPLPDQPLGSGKLHTAAELVELFSTYWRDRVNPCTDNNDKDDKDDKDDSAAASSAKPQKQQQPITVGFVGYPNVGKSSTINALIGAKKVVVSATPGKTKHFQTLPVPGEERIMLCDCPGLVFPSCAATKETMVCDGVLPIDNCRDFVSPISIVCRRVPRYVLMTHYHLDIDAMDPHNDVDHSNSMAEVLLASIARKKGYMTDHERPNRSKAARDLLKDFVDGRFPYVHPPPDFLRLPSWGPWKEIQDLVERLSMSEPEPQIESLGKQQQQQQHHDDDVEDKNENKKNKKANDDDEDEEDEEEGEFDENDVDWEDVDSDDDHDIIDEYDDARDLSDAGDSEPDVDPEMRLYLEIQERLDAGARFYDHKKAKDNTRRTTSEAKACPLTLEEQFNLNPEIVEASFEDPEEAARRKTKKKKMKSHHALSSKTDPDTTYRITSQGYKQVVFDDDDDIDVYVKMSPEQHAAMARARQGAGGSSSRKQQQGQQPNVDFDDDDDIVVSGGGADGYHDDGFGNKQKRLSKKQLRRLEKKQHKGTRGLVAQEEGEAGFTKRGVVGRQ